MTAGPCPHGCGTARPGVDHFRDAGDIDPARAADLGYCPALAALRNRSTTTKGPTVTASPTTAHPSTTGVVRPPTSANGAARYDELVEDFDRFRPKLRRRVLIDMLARATWLLEVRGDGMERVVAHNRQLEARLRAVGYADLATIGVDDVSPNLLAALRELGAAYGPRGVILAALAVLGGQQ